MKVCTCSVCGKSFENNRKIKFCSDQCRAVHLHALKQSYWRRDHELSTAVCTICGKEFTPQSGRQTRCDDCRERKRKLRTPEEEHAKYIRRKYGTEQQRKRYFAEKQAEAEQKRKEMEQQREAKKKAKIIHGICEVCGASFETLNYKQKTCSKTCAKKMRNARKLKRIPKAQRIDNNITLEALYKRDSGVCYICGGMCDWTDKNGLIVGNNYPSIDHIIPVSRGGLHSWQNVRLAHFLCNVKKSNIVPPNAEQLMPINAVDGIKPKRIPKREVVQKTINGAIVATYPSTAEAARQTGFKAKSIQNAARGEMPTYRGYRWEYVA